MYKKIMYITTFSSFALVGFSCDSDRARDLIPPVSNEALFEVRITNNTENQMLTPMAILTHTAQFNMFELGVRASVPLEHLAESGDSSELIALQFTDPMVHGGFFNASTIGGVPAGQSESIQFAVNLANTTHATVATMLSNTNDAFLAEKINITTIPVGTTRRVLMSTWDAGTELNTETAATIPGPPFNGEGFNPERNDIVDFVYSHRGVIGNQDGLATSALDSSYRFVSPSVNFTITRMK